MSRRFIYTRSLRKLLLLLWCCFFASINNVTIRLGL
jgi:hypothetical protein